MVQPEERRIKELRLDPARSVRAKLDDVVVQDYATAIRAAQGWCFPPIEVIREVTPTGDLLWVPDGAHRIEAAERMGAQTIPCVVRLGTLADAIAIARKANTSHGLRRSNADKRRIAEQIVDEEEARVAEGGAPRSNRELADLCNLSHAFIGDVRAARVKAASVNEVIAGTPTAPKAETPEPAPTSAPSSPSRDIVLERVRVLLDLTLAANGPDAQTVLEEGSVLIAPGQYRQLLVRDVLPRLYEMPPPELTAYLAHLERTAEWMIRGQTPPEPAPPPADSPKPWIELDDPRLAGHRGVPAADVDAYQAMKAAPLTTYGQFTQERQAPAPPEGELQRLGKGLYTSKRGGTTEERLAPYADQFGLVDDAEIAGLAGVSVGDVQAARQAKGSATAVAVPTPPTRPWPEIFQESLIARVEALGTPPEALSVVLTSGWRLTLTPPEEDGAWEPDPRRWHDKTFVQAMTPLQGVCHLTGVATALHNIWSHNQQARASTGVGKPAIARQSDAYTLKLLNNPAVNPDDGRVGWPLVKLVRQIRTAETAKDRKAFENDLAIWALGAWPVADETLLYELPVETMITVEGRERSVSFWLKQAPQMAGGARMQLMAEATRLHKEWRADWASRRGAWSDIDWLAGMPVSALKAALVPAMQGPEFITAVGVAVGLTWDSWSAATQRRLIHRLCQHRRPIGAALPSLSAQASPA